MAFRSHWRVVLLTALALAACSAQPTAQATPSATVEPTATAAPSVTPSPSPTVEPSATASPSPSPSPAPSLSPTAAIGFGEVGVLAVDNRVGGWMLTVKLPGVDRSLALLLGGSAYDCTYDAQYADRLFCQGLSKPPYDEDLALAFSDPQTGETLYEGDLLIPTALLVAPTPEGWAGTNCPQRGQDVSCETECRIAPDGNPCIVATCTDACGPYFSVHTCPDMSLDFASCNPEQWAALKKLYQIP